jgi:hypothetical protein
MLLSLFPALERALDLNRNGPLTLLIHYQRPAQLRRAGRKRVATYLRNRGVKGADGLAQKAIHAANSQSVSLPAEEVASSLVAEFAGEVLALKERIEALDEELRARFSPERRRRSSLACRGWVQSLAPSS